MGLWGFRVVESLRRSSNPKTPSPQNIKTLRPQNIKTLRPQNIKTPSPPKPQDPINRNNTFPTICPPSTTSVAPVVKLEAAEAR